MGDGSIDDQRTTETTREEEGMAPPSNCTTSEIAATNTTERSI
jgi:hypothetical protein